MKNKILNLKLTNLEYASICGVNNIEETFIGLDKLIRLRLKNCLLETVLYHGVLNGLSSLKKLELNSNHIEHIEPEVFIHTPMLCHLRIDGIKCKLNEKTFSHLKCLKTIEIVNSDLNHIDSNVLDDIRKLNIEIIIH